MQNGNTGYFPFFILLFRRESNTFAVLKKCMVSNHAIKIKYMKKGIHPENFRLVVFKDMSNETMFLSRSTAPSRETVKWEDGNEYPVIKLEVSNTSHPFYTGKNVMLDTAGRIDKFKKRYAKKA
jgi:large subunit ribosomal protein L31